MTSTPSLKLADVHAGYGNLRVLHGISLEIPAGGVVALLGANGAGKTTTLRAISGFVKARGSVRIDGRSALGMAPEAIVRLGVAHVPQGRGTFPNLTVGENMRAGAAIRRDDAIEGDIEHWYDMFPRLRERSNQHAGSLSGGEQQMLAIGRAMMSKPRLMLMDEPSMGLAPRVTAEVFELLRRINAEDGVAVLLVEQNANLALSLADYAYVIESGEIVLSGLACDLQGDDRVRRAYLRA